MTMTLSEILKTCSDWETFCEGEGFSVWAVNEGGEDVSIELSLEKAERYGIVKVH